MAVEDSVLLLLRRSWELAPLGEDWIYWEVLYRDPWSADGVLLGLRSDDYLLECRVKHFRRPT